jgi:hypothetical protein
LVGVTRALTLTLDADFQLAENTLKLAVESAYKKYAEWIERQFASVEKSGELPHRGAEAGEPAAIHGRGPSVHGAISGRDPAGSGDGQNWASVSKKALLIGMI